MNPLSTPAYIERVNFLKASQYWTKEEHEDYQLKSLQYLVRHIQTRVPFYRDFLKSAGLSWEDFKDIKSIKKFPFIDKSVLQKDYQVFIPDGVDIKSLYHRTTGGSTGTPMTVYCDIDFYGRDKANTSYYMNVFGLEIGQYKSIRLYGDSIDNNQAQKGIYWYEKGDNKLVMSCYHISRDTYGAYLKKINQYRPVYIHTRPSAILPLARQILLSNSRLDFPIRHIFCDGEYITNGQRAIIEQAFQGRLVNVYGHTEGCALGHPCRFSDALHFMPQVGIVEVIDKDGEEVTHEGEKGELVVTGFNNFYFPLVRYKTGDIVIQGEQNCECGRNYRIIEKVEGRIQDYVVDRDDSLVPLAPAIFNYNDMDWKDVKEFKVIQKQKGELEILLQIESPAVNMDEQLEKYVKDSLSMIFGKGFNVEVRIVEELGKTKIGKYRYLEQHLDLTKYF